MTSRLVIDGRNPQLPVFCDLKHGMDRLLTFLRVAFRHADRIEITNIRIVES